MNIEIRKYEFAAGNQKNYLDSPNYIDTIIFNNILASGFPVYSEEFEKSFDTFSFIASDFDLEFSLLQNETSTLGKTIEQFFSEDIDNHCLICAVNLEKTIGGQIDIESITFNKSYADGHYDVRFTVYGLETLLKDFAQSPPINVAVISPAFSLFLNNSFFWDGPKSYINFDCSALNWASQPSGTEPHIVHELWQQITSYSDKSDLADVKIWDLFKDLLIHFGLVYRFEINGTHVNYFRITVYLMFRKNTNPSVDISNNIMSLEQGFKRDTKRAEWLFFKTAKVRNSDHQFYGIISNGNNSTNNKYYLRGKKITGNLDSSIEYAYISNDTLTIYQDNQTIEKDINSVNIIEYSKYFNCQFSEGAYYRQWTFSFLHQEIDIDPIFSQKDYSFPALWIQTGYDTPSNYGLSNPRWKLITSTNYSIYAVIGQYLQFVIVHYKFLYKDFLFKIFRIKLSLRGLSAMKLFYKSMINATQSDLYKLTNRDELNQNVDALFYQAID